MNLLVCGGRDFYDEAALRRAMNDATRGETEVVVIHGGARGADTLAGRIAKQRGIPVRVFHADWDRHGRSAGPKRNQQMLDEGRPDIVLAAPGGIGTADMVYRALAANIPVIEMRRCSAKNSGV